MTKQSFWTEVHQGHRVATIDLHGEINSFAVEGMNAAYEEANRENPEIILLNFTQVGYINSTGIALIVRLLSQARKANQRLIVYGLSDHYREIFQITRLSDYIAIYPDEQSALAEAA